MVADSCSGEGFPSEAVAIAEVATEEAELASAVVKPEPVGPSPASVAEASVLGEQTVPSVELGFQLLGRAL